MLAFMGGFLAFIMFFAIIVSIVTIIANFKLFEKAGVEGWKAIIPIYNMYVTIQIAFSNTKNWLIVTPFLPMIGGLLGENIAGLSVIAASAIYIYIAYSFIRRFASGGVSVASLFFPIIVYPIVAFSSKYEYEEY